MHLNWLNRLRQLMGTNTSMALHAPGQKLAAEAGRSDIPDTAGYRLVTTCHCPMRPSSRAQRIDPFYVMEVQGRQPVGWPGAHGPPMILNIELDFTAPPLVQEAAERAIRAGLTQANQATGLPVKLRAHQRAGKATLRTEHFPRAHCGDGRRIGSPATGFARP